MDVLALAVPLTAVFGLTNLCGSSFACESRFALDAGACLLPLLAGKMRHHLIVFAHGSGFPFADSTAHQLGTIGFPYVHPLHEEVEHTDIAPVEIRLFLGFGEYCLLD